MKDSAATPVLHLASLASDTAGVGRVRGGGRAGRGQRDLRRAAAEQPGLPGRTSSC